MLLDARVALSEPARALALQVRRLSPLVLRVPGVLGLFGVLRHECTSTTSRGWIGTRWVARLPKSQAGSVGVSSSSSQLKDFPQVADYGERYSVYLHP
jgi:hypothetical protein